MRANPELNGTVKTPRVSTTFATGVCGDEVIVPGVVNNCRNIAMLLDSGSQITIIRSDIHHSICGETSLQPVTLKPSAVNGSPITFLGKAWIDITVLGTHVGQSWVFVMSPEHMKNEMILGTDVLEKLGCVSIDFHSKTVSFDLRPIKETPKPDHPHLNQARCCRVQLSTTQVIPAMHEQLCKAVVHDAQPRRVN